MVTMISQGVPPEGIEPPSSVPETDVLSVKLRRHIDLQQNMQTGSLMFFWLFSMLFIYSSKSDYYRKYMPRKQLKTSIKSTHLIFDYKPICDDYTIFGCFCLDYKEVLTITMSRLQAQNLASDFEVIPRWCWLQILNFNECFLTS